MILLDTNVISAVMAPAPPESVLSWPDAQRSAGLFLSTISIADIRYGLRFLPAGRRRQTLEDRFRQLIAQGSSSGSCRSTYPPRTCTPR